MAITASSFKRGTSGGAASFKGMRRFSPKDTTTLLKTVDAINKNLVSINRLLQQQSASTVKAQQQEQKQKRIQRDSIAKDKAEAAIESTKNIGKNIVSGIKKTAKKITGGIFSFLKPFIKFFTVVFIGWFSKGVVAWFKQSAEKKKNQLKEWAPKILKTFAVIGGVILALKVGLPLLLTALGALVASLPLVIGALLNPATWVAILAIGAGIGLTDLFEAGRENFDPGQRARERVRKILKTDESSDLSSYTQGGQKLKIEESKFSGGGPKRKAQFVQIGDKFYRSADISRLLNSKEEFNEEIRTYTKGRGMMQSAGTESVNLQALKEERAFKGDAADFRKKIFDHRLKTRFGAAYKELYMRKLDIERQNIRISDKERLLAQNAGDPARVQTLNEEINDLKSQLPQMQNRQQYAANKVSELFGDLTDEQKKELKGQANITADNLMPDSLSEGQSLYSMRRGLNYLNSQIEPHLNSLTSKIDSATKASNELFNNLINTVSDFEINFNINPVATDDDDGPTQIAPGGVGISPFDRENPFLQFAKQNYVLLGVF